MGETPERPRTHSGLRVSGTWARGVVTAFESLGLDVEALCERMGSDLSIFTDTSNRPPRDALGRFWRAAMAEKSGSRTHQGRRTPLTGFEDRAPHQGAIPFRYTHYH